jgi:hypothetical protein
MMTGQARPSVTIMGFDNHMILEAVPAPPQNARTHMRPSTGHHATMPEPWALPGDSYRLSYERSDRVGDGR